MTNGRARTGSPSARCTTAPLTVRATCPSYTVVVATLGRPSLLALLDALDAGYGPGPTAVLVVDDRRHTGNVPLAVPSSVAGAPVRVLRSGGRGPAAARDAGWRAAATPWVAYLDDDVVPEREWTALLATDLSGLGDDVGGSQGRLFVPRQSGHRTAEGVRRVLALDTARGATADLAYRRHVLATVGGFDLRFARALPADVDLGRRVTEAGWTIVRGDRRSCHPVPPADPWASLRAQRAKRDDVLMAALHGPGWRDPADGSRSRTGRHLATTGAAALAVAGIALRRRPLTLAGAAGWSAGTAELARAHLAPGPPRGVREVGTVLATSAAEPVLATWHLLAGTATLPAKRRRPGPSPEPVVRAVLFDRDGLLVEDVPFDGVPAEVRPVPGAAAAVRRLRQRGVKLGVMIDQRGIGQGVLGGEQVDALEHRLDELVGPMDTWQVCPHGPDDGCRCAKPGPGLVERAAAALGVPTSACVVIGHAGADVAAARAAGARAILVPAPATPAAEVSAAPEVAPTLDAAVERLLNGAR